jgi:hypothetical protein
MRHPLRLLGIVLPLVALLVTFAPASVAAADDETVYVTRTGAKYHRASCSSLRSSSIPMKLSEAAVRYGPCSRCSPPTLKQPAKVDDADSITLKEPAKTKSQPAAAGRCQAMTRKGTQCSRRAKAGSSYCWQHGS